MRRRNRIVEMITTDGTRPMDVGKTDGHKRSLFIVTGRDVVFRTCSVRCSDVRSSFAYVFREHGQPSGALYGGCPFVVAAEQSKTKMAAETFGYDKEMKRYPTLFVDGDVGRLPEQSNIHYTHTVPSGIYGLFQRWPVSGDVTRTQHIFRS